jgi:hypothetical protein
MKKPCSRWRSADFLQGVFPKNSSGPVQTYVHTCFSKTKISMFFVLRMIWTFTIRGRGQGLPPKGLKLTHCGRIHVEKTGHKNITVFHQVHTFFSSGHDTMYVVNTLPQVWPFLKKSWIKSRLTFLSLIGHQIYVCTTVTGKADNCNLEEKVIINVSSNGILDFDEVTWVDVPTHSSHNICTYVWHGMRGGLKKMPSCPRVKAPPTKRLTVCDFFALFRFIGDQRILFCCHLQILIQCRHKSVRRGFLFYVRSFTQVIKEYVLWILAATK